MLCIECGAEISPRRLAVMPNATRCTPCQSKVDDPITATNRKVIRSLVELSEPDEGMFHPEAHE